VIGNLLADATPRIGAICDRCYQPYFAATFPHNCLCPGCFLAIVTPAQRGRLLSDFAVTGRRIA
jgi:hypothetical protein